MLPKAIFQGLKNVGYPLDTKDFVHIDGSYIESFDFIICYEKKEFRRDSR